MSEPKGKPQPTWLLGGLSKIVDEDWARKLAKGGGVAAYLLTASELLGTILSIYGLDPTTGKPIPKVDTASFEFMVMAGVLSLGLVIMLVMSWRTYIGKGLISPVLLLILLMYEAYSKIVGGTLGGGWAVIYLGLMISLVGAARAAWYLRKTKKTPSLVEHF